MTSHSSISSSQCGKRFLARAIKSMRFVPAPGGEADAEVKDRKTVPDAGRPGDDQPNE